MGCNPTREGFNLRKLALIRVKRFSFRFLVVQKTGVVTNYDLSTSMLNSPHEKCADILQERFSTEISRTAARSWSAPVLRRFGRGETFENGRRQPPSKTQARKGRDPTLPAMYLNVG